MAAPGWREFDPRAIPWSELRKYPEKFPHFEVAKVASLRTVVGLDAAPYGGPAERVFVKRSYDRPGLLARIVALWRPAKELRELRVLRAFIGAGYVVPEPLFYAETRIDGRTTRFLVTRALSPEWRPAEAWFASASPPEWEERWMALAVYTRALHAAGALHADYRIAHLYLRPVDTTAWAMIDMDGSRLGAPPSCRERRRAMLQLVESMLPLGLKEEALGRFLKAYDPAGEWRMQPAGLIAEVQQKLARRGD
jgi:hypothetical protein